MIDKLTGDRYFLPGTQNFKLPESVHPPKEKMSVCTQRREADIPFYMLTF